MSKFIDTQSQEIKYLKRERDIVAGEVDQIKKLVKGISEEVDILKDFFVKVRASAREKVITGQESERSTKNSVNEPFNTA